MRTLSLAAVAVTVAVGHTQAPLGVLRATPDGDAEPWDTVMVTFDRPVAGRLDASVDPASFFEIRPAVTGRLEWRDPITVRLVPDALLPPDTRYAVTIRNTFQATDGSRLEEPFEFSFRVRGPRAVNGTPASGTQRTALHLTPDQRFELLLSGPADSALIRDVLRLEFDRACATPARRVVPLLSVAQRPVRPDDRWEYRSVWIDRSPVEHRRVLSLAPRDSLPRGCAGALVFPARLDRARAGPDVRWPIQTYGDFTLSDLACPTGRPWCPTGPALVRFATPVRGADVVRHVRLYPATTFTVHDTAHEAADWMLQATLTPLTRYGVVVDTGIRDVFGQRLRGNPARTLETTGYEPSVTYTLGRQLAERNGARTLTVQHRNVDSLEVLIAPIPDSLEGPFLRSSWWSWRDLWPAVATTGERRWIAVPSNPENLLLTGIPVPVFDASRRGSPTLVGIAVTSPDLRPDPRNPETVGGGVTVLQVTNLGVHARIGIDRGAVWVTGVDDGLPRAGAAVTLYDERGRSVATGRTNEQGLARLVYAAPAPTDDEGEDFGARFEGHLGVVLGPDRGVVGISEYDPDLSPWRFNVRGAWGSDRYPDAGAVFTERGIYRPGERVYAKAITRLGLLGALDAPPPGDSVRLVFYDRDGGTQNDTTLRLSEFGTTDHAVTLPGDAPLGEYRVAVQHTRGREWRTLASASYRVAEYRPPEFLVTVAADTAPRFGGDSLHATVEARYLFGAPMAGAAVQWTLRQEPLSPWAIAIPGASGYMVGERGRWWEEGDGTDGPRVAASGVDSLDASGAVRLAVVLDAPPAGAPARATLQALVTDVNRQTVATAARATVHPASFYVGVRPLGRSYFWRAGEPQELGVIAVQPDGRRVPNVAVSGVIVRREWHRVRRVRDGVGTIEGEWVSDTVARCDLRSGGEPVPCRFTPPAGGSYTVRFSAKDQAGREAATSFYRWATGPDWVPWYDETQFKMDLVPDRDRYMVGDTAAVLLAAPFIGAEAWLTVEREGVIEERRLRISEGATTIRLPITEAYVPNAFVSVLMVRGRSGAPGSLDDPGRPTIRVGYAEVHVEARVKRLAVDVEPVQPEYRPGDTARVRLAVRDASGAPERAEVTLWAVDEGVLALTGYETPDPVELIYRPRGLGLRLASNLVAVAPQVVLEAVTVARSEKGGREPGGGGGAEGADILRSRFSSTAFFLGSVVTGPDGRAEAHAKLPDNLTTFRLMAVAVGVGDRYGSGESSMLVTRPLVARPALPRFLREGDRFTAGVVVNTRTGQPLSVSVEAAARDASLQGPARRSVTLDALRATEVRFPFLGLAADTAAFRFTVRGNGHGDAVELRLPVEPRHYPRAHVVAGTLVDTASIDLPLPGDIDPARSVAEVSLGTSPLSVLLGMQQQLRVYPYYCSEQIVSVVRPLIALYRADREALEARSGASSMRRIERAVATLVRRQRPDGGIGLWSPSDWTSPWLSAYAGLALLEARAAGITVRDTVLAQLASYMAASLTGTDAVRTVLAAWYGRDPRILLAERVAAVEFLRRVGRPNVAAENALLAQAPQLGWEDRARLAELISARGDVNAARALLEPAWQATRVEGRLAVTPALASESFYFPSRTRAASRLLTATLAVDPAHPLVGPLFERVLVEMRAGALNPWNTQDYGAAVSALAAVSARTQGRGGRPVAVRSGTRVVMRLRGAVADSSVHLTGLLTDAGAEKRLRLQLEASPGDPVYYYVTVRETPTAPPVTPDDRGIAVERWYEDYETGRPIVSAPEGGLVRVRLRLTVPSERYMVVLDDPLPAGLEAVDLSLRTAGELPPPGTIAESEAEEYANLGFAWHFGSWDSGWWSPFEHRELRDDRVVYFATMLWPGSYSTSYVARATTPGTFARPPAHAEEMYNPAVHGRTDGGEFTVTAKGGAR